MPTTPGGSNDLQDMDHLTSLRPPGWVSEPQRHSSTPRYTALRERLSQTMHRRNLENIPGITEQAAKRRGCFDVLP